MNTILHSDADLELDHPRLTKTYFRKKCLAVTEDYQDGGFILQFFEDDEEMRVDAAKLMSSTRWRITRGDTWGITQCNNCDNFMTDEQAHWHDELTPLCPDCFALSAPYAPDRRSVAVC